MAVLPPKLPTPSPGALDKRNPWDERYLDPADILRNYDQAVVDLFRIPIPSDKVNRLYFADELSQYTVEQLVTLGNQLGVSTSSARKDQLIKAIVNAQAIPINMATPSPAYSAQELVTGRKEGSPMSSNVRYPAMSVLRLPPQVDGTKFVRRSYRHIQWISDEKEVIQGMKPTAVVIPYQIECIANLQTHANIMDQWIERMFNGRALNTYVDLGQPWGSKFIQIFKESSYQDNTEYEQESERAEKIVKHIHSIRLEGWLPSPVWRTPTVVKVKEGIFLEPENTLAAETEEEYGIVNVEE